MRPGNLPHKTGSIINELLTIDAYSRRSVTPLASVSMPDDDIAIPDNLGFTPEICDSMRAFLAATIEFKLIPIRSLDPDAQLRRDSYRASARTAMREIAEECQQSGVPLALVNRVLTKQLKEATETRSDGLQR